MEIVEQLNRINDNIRVSARTKANPRNLKVRTIRIDLDTRETFRGISELGMIVCPICHEWTANYRFIPEKFLSIDWEKLELKTMIEVVAHASPRHTWRLNPTPDKRISHSDTKYQGWADYHSEFVRAIFSDIPDYQIVDFVDQEYLQVLCHDNRPISRAVLYSGNLLDPREFDEIANSPHFSCYFSEEFFESIQEYRLEDIGNLQVYRLKHIEDKEFPEVIEDLEKHFFPNFYPDLPLVNHIINYQEEFVGSIYPVYKYNAFNGEIVLISFAAEFIVESLHHDRVTLEGGYYLLYHQNPSSIVD